MIESYGFTSSELESALTEEQRRAGLHLEEEGDHFLLLKKADRVVAVFNSTTVTIAAIRSVADKQLMMAAKGG